MLNLNSTVELDFKRFLRWWWRELLFLVPENLRRFINDQQAYLLATPNNGHFSLSYLRAGETQFLADIARNETGAAQLKALLESDEKFAKARVHLRLGDHDALHRELVLPAAAKENLQQVVAYELDRYTPFKAEQVYFALQPLPLSAEPGQLRVMLVFTPKEVLDAVYEDAKALGLSPVLCDCAGFPNASEDSVNPYNLLPERLLPKTAKTPQMVHTGLSLATAFLLLAVLVMPLVFQYQTVQALAAKVKTIEKDAKKIKVLQQEVDDVISETQKLLDEKRNRPPMVRIFNELSSLIKDDTWLAYLQMSDGHLQLQGESPAASNLIGVLEASDLFNNARFVSPVTQNTVTKLERFQITVDVTGVKPLRASE